MHNSYKRDVFYLGLIDDEQSYWKRRIATTLQRVNALFILNSSAHVLSATNRFDPECEPHLDEVLNQERIQCS